MLGLIEELWWRFRACPRTTESAARDFLFLRNPERVQAVLADPDSWRDGYAADFKSRIACHYGLTFRSGWRSAGWNRHLLADAGPEPEQAAERILRCACELAKLHHPGPPGIPGGMLTSA